MAADSSERFVLLNQLAEEFAERYRRGERPSQLTEKSDLTTPSPSGCTSGCTGEAESVNTGSVEALAAALLGLSYADRARLAAMLFGQVPRTGTTADKIAFSGRLLHAWRWPRERAGWEAVEGRQNRLRAILADREGILNRVGADSI
jgi:hypothetical protein